MPWSRASQRVLIVLAAALLVFAAVQGRGPAQEQVAVSVPDDPALDLRLDINSATAADLETLAGVGMALAGKLVAYRSLHGRFTSVDELRQVSGFSEKLVATLRPLVIVR